MAADGVPKAPIELQGGTLALESEVGDGTIVTICFPSERVLDAPAGTEIENIEIGTAS